MTPNGVNGKGIYALNLVYDTSTDLFGFPNRHQQKNKKMKTSVISAGPLISLFWTYVPSAVGSKAKVDPLLT